MKEKILISPINLQLFADPDNTDSKPAPSDEPVDNPAPANPTPPVDNPTPEPNPLDALKAKNKQKMEELTLTKLQEVEAANATLNTKLSKLEQLLEKLVPASQGASPQPTPQDTNTALAVTQREEILLNEVAKVQNEMRLRDERDFINEQIKQKPYMSTAIKNAKITTKADYIRFMLPLEEDYKEKDNLSKKITENQERDIYSEYGGMGTVNIAGNNKYKKQLDEANMYGDSILDGIL